jgi:hypothetical protein
VPCALCPVPRSMPRRAPHAPHLSGAGRHAPAVAHASLGRRVFNMLTARTAFPESPSAAARQTAPPLQRARQPLRCSAPDSPSEPASHAADSKLGARAAPQCTTQAGQQTAPARAAVHRSPPAARLPRRQAACRKGRLTRSWLILPAAHANGGPRVHTHAQPTLPRLVGRRYPVHGATDAIHSTPSSLRIPASVPPCPAMACLSRHFRPRSPPAPHGPESTRRRDPERLRRRGGEAYAGGEAPGRERRTARRACWEGAPHTRRIATERVPPLLLAARGLGPAGRAGCRPGGLCGERRARPSWLPVCWRPPLLPPWPSAWWYRHGCRPREPAKKARCTEATHPRHQRASNPSYSDDVANVTASSGV